MIVSATVLGVLIIGLLFLIAFMSAFKKGDMDCGLFFGSFTTMLIMIEISVICNILKRPQPTEPTAMDVYQGKTTLEYKIVDGVKIDSIVIFKNE